MRGMRGTMKVTQEGGLYLRSLLPINPEPLVCKEEMVVAPSEAGTL